MLQRSISAIIALKVPTKRWLESDSVIKEAQNHQRYQLDEDNGRFMQLQQDQLNLFVITASYYMTRIFTTFTFKWNKATRHIFQKSCWLELWHDLWPCWLWIKILKDLLFDAYWNCIWTIETWLSRTSASKSHYFCVQLNLSW